MLFVRESLPLIFGLIGAELEAGEDVAIAWFGQWKVRESPGGMRRNPRTGAPAKVGPSKKVRFYPASHPQGGRRLQARPPAHDAATRLTG
ncbi:MAG TPA: HU family DNA-binding protein [Candidatus Dormibacteraeota bacterium]|nr:HU family DNA-binding protein [Candidatus Dormibacteraeota bacterium]